MEVNPYESPPDESRSAVEPPLFAETTYYRPDSRRLTVAEYWRLSKGVVEFLIAMLLKLLRIRLPMEFAFGEPSHSHLINPGQISAEAREALRPLADEATGLGLRYALTYGLPTVGRTETVAAAFWSGDGRILVPIVTAKTWTNVSVDRRTVFACVTQLSDGRTLVTSGGRRELNVARGYLIEHHPRRPMREVVARHQQRMAEFDGHVIAVPDVQSLEVLIRAHEKLAFDFQVQRGVYVPVPPAEVERLRQINAEPVSAKQVKPTPLQGLELVCWIVLGLVLMLWTGNAERQPAQLLFRVGMIFAALAGLVSIWIYRAVRRRAERPSS